MALAMSPPPLRRYRAERLLRREFERQRSQVLAIVRRRLHANGVALDDSDLEECYGVAWHGLYATVLAGEEVANPTGWLALVCFRRAIDESRSRGRERDRIRADEQLAALHAAEPDLAGELDDRARLRQIFEGLRGRLSRRECEAATLCYLHGLSRAEAAARMGISQARMRKLMEGAGPGRPGVAGKVGELLESVRAGGFCEQQSSLMRGLAYGILDPDGERYRLAQLHSGECPACRAYVLSLRGMAAVLPPLFLPWGIGAGAGAGATAGATGTGAAGAGAAPSGLGAGVGSAAGSGVGAGGGVATRGLGAGAPIAPAGTGVSLSIKLAAAGVLVAGAVGGGAALLARSGSHVPHVRHGVAAVSAGQQRELVPPHSGASKLASKRPVAAPARRTVARRVARRARGPAPSEFSPEQGPIRTASVGSSGTSSGSAAAGRREFGVP
jgi:RNA polymerase sigma factor (sigma-70 family)